MWKRRYCKFCALKLLEKCSSLSRNMPVAVLARFLQIYIFFKGKLDSRKVELLACYTVNEIATWKPCKNDIFFISFEYSIVSFETQSWRLKLGHEIAIDLCPSVTIGIGQLKPSADADASVNYTIGPSLLIWHWRPMLKLIFRQHYFCPITLLTLQKI